MNSVHLILSITFGASSSSLPSDQLGIKTASLQGGKDLPLDQLGIKKASLQGDLHEEVYSCDHLGCESCDHPGYEILQT